MFFPATYNATRGAPAISDYFDMGGYGAFIWPAYGVAAATLVVLLLVSLDTRRRLREELTRLEESGRLRRRRSTNDRGRSPEPGESDHDAETP